MIGGNRMIYNYFNEALIEKVNRWLKEIPFYNNYGVNEVEDYQDFLKIPILNKVDYSDNWRSILKPGSKESELVIDYTSGSTGKPLKVIRSISEFTSVA